jgi:hypothetical protein
MLASIFISFPICRIDDNLNKDNCILQLSYKPLVFNNSSSSLSNIFDEISAVEISSNKNLFVCCSGGIDSTTIVASFIKNTNKQIGILYNEHSIAENKDLFEVLRKFNVKFYECDLKTIDMLLENPENNIYTGTPADIILEPFIDKKYDNIGYKDYLYNNLFEEFFILEKYKNKSCLNDFIDHIDHLVSLSPFNIKVVKDMWWWVGLSTMYNGLNHIWHCTTSNKRYPINFYDNQLFIDYSVNNHINNKEEMRNYSLSVLKEDRCIQKSKIKSSKMLNEREDDLVCINESLNKIFDKHNRYEFSFKKMVKYLKEISNLEKGEFICQ